MVFSCASVIPELHTLIVKQEAPFARSHEEAVQFSTNEGDWRIHEWEGTWSRKNSMLRVAIIPMALLVPLLPVLYNLAVLELTIPPYVVEFKDLDDILKLLPASLLGLTLRDSVPFWKDPPRYADAEHLSEVKLLDLKELKLLDFIPEVCQAIMTTIICPQLERFSYDVVRRYESVGFPLELSYISGVYRELRILHLFSKFLMVSRYRT